MPNGYSMSVKEARGYGYDEGRFSFATVAKYDLEPEKELREAWEKDELQEIVSGILENYAQYADTIYYQGVSDEALDAFEEGFLEGFEDAADEYFD